MSFKDILNVSQTLQASALTMDSAKLSTKKNLKVDDMLHSATKTLVGTALIKEQGKLISSL
jgi:hypothetical protein